MKSKQTPFGRFKAAYPKAKGKWPQAEAYWREHGLDTREQDIMRGLRAWNESAEWLNENGRFVPNPFSFLEEKRYLDPPDPADGWKPQRGPLTEEQLRDLVGPDVGHPPIRLAKEYWLQSFLKRNSVADNWTSSHDMALYQLQRHAGEDTHKVIDAYFRSTDSYVVQNRFPLSLLVKNLPRYTREARIHNPNGGTIRKVYA